VAGLSLEEWRSVGFEEEGLLRGVELSPRSSELAEALTTSGRLKIDEHRKGLRLQATSFVGRVDLGELTITVEPKIARRDLLRLFEYAYDLDDLHLYDDTSYGSTDVLFVDLVVQRLLREVRRLRERGLHRAYVRVAEDLGSPRGGIDMSRIVGAIASGSALVPCVHHPRAEDHLLNRVLKAGLLVAARVAHGSAIRVAAMRAAATFEGIATVPLSEALLARCEHALDRRVLHYAPMLRLVEILWSGTSLDMERENHRVEVPGFLYDMNRFWQVLLGRLLRENLEDVTVVEDRALRGVLRYSQGFHHPKFRAPTARPDFVLTRNGKTVAVLDAKYRDLWRRELPPSMLYQLAVYASVQGPGGVATILYPPHSADAREVRIEVCPPGWAGPAAATVVLRPVHVARLAEAVGSHASSERGRWVRTLAGFSEAGSTSTALRSLAAPGRQ
jgi:5-methylcytosine-specific restriction enzyme subunit McrC